MPSETTSLSYLLTCECLTFSGTIQDRLLDEWEKVPLSHVSQISCASEWRQDGTILAQKSSLEIPPDNQGRIPFPKIPFSAFIVAKVVVALNFSLY